MENSHIYKATYSGVPVYELMCRGIAVMRRKLDSYLNATQILKVAGIEKGKRTKILEREVLIGEHEKVEPLLRCLFEYNEDDDSEVPTKEMFQAAQKAKSSPKPKKTRSPRISTASKQNKNTTTATTTTTTTTPARSVSQALSHASSMTPSPLHPSFTTASPSIPPSPQLKSEPPPRKRIRTNNSPPPLHEFDDEGPRSLMNEFVPLENYNNSRQSSSYYAHYPDPYENKDYGYAQFQAPPPPPEEPPLEGAEKYRSILMSIFLNDEQDQIPGILTDPELPFDFDINLVIDDQGHTALHWAAALARIPILDLLVQKQADIRRVNYNGESALVRAVLVTNNFDKQSFPHVLSLLHSAIPLVDRKNRTLLHHIAVTAGIKGRESSSRYYIECLFEWIAGHGGDFASIIDIQDKSGDTALTIAARVGDQYLTKILLDVGANREIENKVGLKAEDFGIDDSLVGPLPPSQQAQPTTAKKPAPIPEIPGKRGKDLMNVVQKMVDELDIEFSHEIMARQGQLQDTQVQLRQFTSELSNTRRMIIQCRGQYKQLNEAQIKIKNLEQSLEEESQRTRSQRGYTSSLRQREAGNEDIDNLFSYPVRPTSGPKAVEDKNLSAKERSKAIQEEITSLRARIHAYEENNKEMSQELVDVKDQSLDREFQYRKVISICCKIPLEKVDDMLVPLTLAVESDGASLDLSRVAGFMSKVKKQEAIASMY
ncbi:transcriptional regulator swi6 [Entomortierella beljakovae]|nr:transcriptional regulator swi6 [Entomortierella beljakovae]